MGAIIGAWPKGSRPTTLPASGRTILDEMHTRGIKGLKGFAVGWTRSNVYDVGEWAVAVVNHPGADEFGEGTECAAQLGKFG